MGVQISDTIVAEQDCDGHWYLRDTVKNLVSQEFFISVAIIEKCLRQGLEVTWEREEADIGSGE